jgi:aminopeptidase N
MCTAAPTVRGMRCPMRRLLVMCVLAACGDDPPTGPITAHVTHYDYRIDIMTRTARATLTLEVDQGGDCITLPMRATVLAAPEMNGETSSVAVTGNEAIFCGGGFETGSTLELAIDIEVPLAVVGTSQVGYSITRDAQGNDFYYLVSWVNGCDRFGPCDNRPDQFATYRFTVTHPAAYTARCPGTITEVSDTQTVCDFQHDGGPTYSTFGLAAYPAWTQTDRGTWGGVKITLYDRPITAIGAAIDTAYHSGFMDWMQSQFGPYPYGDELRVLTAPTYWGGFEHPGNIILDDGLARQQRPSYANPTAHTLDHEIVHMWAGDQTTLASTYDFVWKEAMAEYLTYVWEDMQSAASGTQTAGAWKSFSIDAAYYPVPLDQPELFDYYGDVYGPGPMIFFRQLEVMTSRAQVLAGLQMLLGTQRALSVDEVITALSQTTGLDLTAYATAWIRGSGAPGWPRYNVTFAAGVGTSTLALTQVNKGAIPRGCKFKVALRGATQGDELLVDVNTFTGGVDQTLQVATPAFTVTDVVLDPEAQCLVYAMTTSPRVVGESGPRVSSPFNTPQAHPWARKQR